MRTIDINTARPYQITVGTNLLGKTGDYISRDIPGAETAAVITDDTVDELYGSIVRDSIRETGRNVCSFVLPHGESSKNAESYLQILNFLAEERITRSDLIVALGGGVVGDLAGFAAATYLRGIRFIQMPTTLLAQVDASVGGKTAVDIPAGKNLAGAFWQPSFVLCDLDALDTLPEDIFRDGCAEVIKYGILWDADLLGYLQVKGIDFDREYAVTRCIEMKRTVVEGDEYDRGRRQFLNFGHTLAHAAEKLSGYRLSHGKAVAMGMAVMARAAAAEGSCSHECAEEIMHVLERFDLPTTFENSLEELFETMLSDKKRSGSRISLVLPEEIGCCTIRSCTLEEMKTLIAPGMVCQREKGEIR